MNLKLYAAIFATTAVCSSVSAEPVKRVTDPVLATIQEFSDARANFDAAKLARLLTSDYVEVSPRGELDRRPAVLGFYTADKASAAPPMAFSTQDARRYGDTAIVIGTIEYTVPAPTGGLVKRAVRATYVERRVGGRWLMASAQFTGIPPAPAPR
jgi:ketosteroid isomerase-like protein